MDNKISSRGSTGSSSSLDELSALRAFDAPDLQQADAKPRWRLPKVRRMPSAPRALTSLAKTVKSSVSEQYEKFTDYRSGKVEKITKYRRDRKNFRRDRKFNSHVNEARKQAGELIGLLAHLARQQRIADKTDVGTFRDKHYKEIEDFNRSSTTSMHMGRFQYSSEKAGQGDDAFTVTILINELRLVPEEMLEDLARYVHSDKLDAHLRDNAAEKRKDFIDPIGDAGFDVDGTIKPEDGSKDRNDDAIDKFVPMMRAAVKEALEARGRGLPEGIMGIALAPSSGSEEFRGDRGRRSDEFRGARSRGSEEFPGDRSGDGTGTIEGSEQPRGPRLSTE